MLRDCNRTETYFTDYLTEQDRRIRRFSEKLDRLTQEHKPAEKILQCHAILAKMLHDKLYAQYSLGCPKEAIRETFDLYLDHIKNQKKLTYQDAAEVLSLSIVFRCPVQESVSADSIPDDDLLKALYTWSGERKTSQTSNGLLFPNTSKVFWEVLQGLKSVDELRNYIQDKWYSDNHDASWFDAARRNDGTYCGYWCFLGAAVAVIMGFDKALFKECRYFPVDIL